MPAHSLDDLLDFESHWDAALRQVLAQLGLPVHVGEALTTQEADPAYLAAYFTFLGEAPAGNGPLTQVRGGSGATAFDPVSYRGRLTFMLGVNRQKATTAQKHAWRGGIRRLLLPSRITADGAFNGVVLPYYDLRTVTLEAGDRGFDEARDLDITTMQVAIDWAIRPEAWPA